jgi:hypothetical protein
MTTRPHSRSAATKRSHRRNETVAATHPNNRKTKNIKIGLLLPRQQEQVRPALHVASLCDVQTREQPKPENIAKVSFSWLITKTCLS